MPGTNLEVDIERIVSPDHTGRALCRAYVDRLLRLSDVDSAAIWVQAGLIRETTEEVFDLAKALPAKGAAPQLELDHELVDWARRVGAFGWRASDHAIPGTNAPVTLDAGVNLAFAQEGKLILLLNLRTALADVSRVQSSLAQLAGHLLQRRDSKGVGMQQRVTVDLAFLDAMAMGDDEFITHMLALAMDQIDEGLDSLLEAARLTKADEVGHIAHRLRSSARTVGANRLDELLGEVEAEADKGRIAGVRPAVRGCEQAVNALSRQLRGRPV